MRPRPEAGVLLHAPVFQIVAGFLTGLGEIGDLVLLVAHLAQRRHGVQVHIRLRVVVRQRQRLPLLPQGRTLLQLQTVAGKMLRPQRHGVRQRPLPVLHGLPRQAVDQIQTQICELRLPRRHHRLLHLLIGVYPPDAPQQGVVGGLHAEGQTVEARPPQLPQLLPVPGAVGIGLQRDLRVPCHVVPPKHRLQDTAKPRRTQIAGRAAAEIHRIHLHPGGAGRYLLQMAQQRRRVGVHLLLAVGQRVEVAIGALGLAEGDVDIQPQRGLSLPPAHGCTCGGRMVTAS